MTEATGAGLDRPATRPLGLADTMILIMAVGLGLALAGPAFMLIGDAVRSGPRSRFLTLSGAIPLGRMLNIALLNFLFFLLPAWLIVRIRRPRPTFRSLVRQPGFAACAPPVLIFLAALPLSMLPLPESVGRAIEVAGQGLVVSAAPLAWAILLATRSWKAEPGWIDRLGRFLGALAMICLPAHLVLIRLPY